MCFLLSPPPASLPLPPSLPALPSYPVIMVASSPSFTHILPRVTLLGTLLYAEDTPFPSTSLPLNDDYGDDEGDEGVRKNYIPHQID